MLDAASALFYQRGIHAVGVDTIAAAAGVTKKTLYDRFGAKDQIVALYLAERQRRWREHLEAWLTEVPDAERPLAVFDAAANWAAENSRRGCAHINARAELPDPTHPGFAVIDDAKRYQLDRFHELLSALPSTAAPVDELARQLYLLYEGALVSGGLETVSDAWAIARAAATRLLRAD